jgi:hypothetical protein
MDLDVKMDKDSKGEVSFYLPSSSAPVRTSLTKMHPGRQYVFPGEVITSETGYLR